MFYLGNYRIDSFIKDDVEQAAKNTKRNIRFLDTPMPIIDHKTKIEQKYIDGFGCITVYDDKKDCSKFWREFHRIRNMRENENSA